MKLPRVLVATTMAMGCSAQPSNDKDAGTDAGTDGGLSGACVPNMPCDAGAGQPAGECFQESDGMGGMFLKCEMLI